MSNTSALYMQTKNLFFSTVKERRIANETITPFLFYLYLYSRCSNEKWILWQGVDKFLNHRFLSCLLKDTRHLKHDITFFLSECLSNPAKTLYDIYTIAYKDEFRVFDFVNHRFVGYSAKKSNYLVSKQCTYMYQDYYGTDIRDVVYETEQCIVCFSSLEMEKTILPCGHSFHLNCIEPFIDQQSFSSCPFRCNVIVCSYPSKVLKVNNGTVKIIL